MGNDSKARAASLDQRIAGLSPERREVLEKALRRRAPTSRHAQAEIPRREPSDTAPLSQGQWRIWVLDQLAQGSSSYNESTTMPLLFAVDVPVLERCVNEIVRRHEILRTTFESVDGQVVQKIAPSLFVPLPLNELRELASADRESEVLRLAREEALRPFDLVRGPLIRTRLLRRGDADYVFLLTMHHIVCDGWSEGVFAWELTTLYPSYAKGVPSRLAELPIQYADFAVWQRALMQGDALEREVSYWKEQLAGLAVLQLPTDRPRPARLTFKGARQAIVIPESLSDAIDALCKRENASLFMGLLAAFQTLLHRYSGQDDIVIGVPAASRNRRETEGLIGFFVNTLVMRTDVSGNPSFRELLRRVRHVANGAYDHHELPFEKLVEELRPERDLSRHPLFQVAFQLFRAPSATYVSASQIPPLRTVDTGSVKLDLRVDLMQALRGFEGYLEYNTDLFDAATVGRMAGHLLTLLHGIVANPDQAISELPILTPTERDQLLIAWNQTGAAYPNDLCAHELFEAEARRAPDAVAVVCEDQHLTYGELNRRANQLAHYLQWRGVGPETLVGICMGRSPEMIVAVLAIWKSGGAFLPLDPAYPHDRLKLLQEDARPAILLTEERWLERTPTTPARRVLVDAEARSIARESEDNVTSAATPDNLAYMMYTSGSTGRPKGVMVAHRGLSNVAAEQIRRFDVRPDSRIFQFAPLSFDASAFEMLMALTTGAALCIAPKEALIPGPALYRTLREQAISIVTLPPSALAALPEEALPDLRVLNVAGEAMPEQLGARWASGRRMFNLYGPTESSIWATVAEIDSAVAPVIGRPIGNIEAYVLDRRHQPVPIGVPGELHLGGVGLAWGYFNRPEVTAEKFIPHPFTEEPGERLYRTGDLVRCLANGDLEYLGRIDRQVKLRGFRIELGEIETVLGQSPGVKQCVVIARTDASLAKRLVAYVELAREASADTAQLRRHLQQQLPDFMIPSTFVVLDALPVTANGKVDREVLAATEVSLAADEPYAEPRSPAEKTLSAIWAKVLRVERVGVHDNFFELGGDSIISTQIIARALEAGLQLTLRQLFDNPTVAELAAVAGTEAAVHGEQETLEGQAPLTPIQLWFFEQQLADPHHFNQAALLETPQGLDPALLEQATAHLLVQHDALRLRFVRGKGRWRQFYESPGGPAPFASVDMRSLAASELHAGIEREAAKAQGSLDLQAGPIARVVWFDLGDRPGRLLFVVHHLAVDSVSWRPLLEDFWRAYEGLARGQQVALPAKTTSMRQWARRLDEYAQSMKAREELAYWTRVTRGAEWRVPLDLPGGPNVAGVMPTVTVELEEDETRELVQETPKAYHTQINDVLVTALAQALGRWTGQRVIRIDLEGHGREPLFDEVDLARTVGWFTTIFPVRVALDSDDPGEALKSIKEQLRQIPNHGFTYGVLRYLSNDLGVTAQLSALPDAHVGFNYLGQLGAIPVLESSGAERSPRNQRRHLLEINGAIAGGRLRVHWGYSGNHHHRATIERVAEDFVAYLRAVIAHCRSPKAGGFTPADFAQARISQAELDKLVAAVNKSERRKP